jgi:hypothetical protein
LGVTFRQTFSELLMGSSMAMLSSAAASLCDHFRQTL